MQIEITGDTERLVQKLIAQGEFQSANEAVAYALAFLDTERPTMDVLSAKLREAHQAHESGQSMPLDMDAVKAELHSVPNLGLTRYRGAMGKAD